MCRIAGHYHPTALERVGIHSADNLTLCKSAVTYSIIIELLEKKEKVFSSLLLTQTSELRFSSQKVTELFLFKGGKEQHICTLGIKVSLPSACTVVYESSAAQRSTDAAETALSSSRTFNVIELLPAFTL